MINANSNHRLLLIMRRTSKYIVNSNMCALNINYEF